jgi:hypothetical protein
MTISAKILNDTLIQVSGSNTLIDMLLEFEKILDDLDLYAYANWIEGEILEGPILHRHWIEVRLIYPHHLMPEPDGARRLIARNILVTYTRNVLRKPRELKTSADTKIVTRPDGSTRRVAVTKDEPVWVVSIKMPRQLVDEFKTDLVSIGDGEYLDTEALNAEGELLAQQMVKGAEQ